MANTETSCQNCGSPVTAQIDRLDLGWAGDGPYEEFAGILADVLACDACGRVVIRPVRLDRAHRVA
jgi:hypothetical protein